VAKETVSETSIGTVLRGSELRQGDIGYEATATGEVTVSGTDSSWTNSGELFVGYHGDGTLDITDAGAVSSARCWIAYDSGPAGAVTVSGAGSTWTSNGSLCVGGSYIAAGGAGTLTVQNGGTVNVADTLKVWGTGTVSGSGIIDAGDAVIAGTLSPGDDLGTLRFRAEITCALFLARVARPEERRA